jgi:hypothetical protein
MSSSLINGGFPVSSVDDSTRSGNKTGFFPAGGVVGGVKLLSLLLSVGLVLGSCARCCADSGLPSIADGGVVRFVLLLLFCERAEDLDIPDVGLLFRVADLFSNGGSYFRSLAFGPAAAELLSPSLPAVPTADVRSASTIRLGGWPGRWLLRHIQSLGVAQHEGRWNLPGSGVRLRRTGAR